MNTVRHSPGRRPASREQQLHQSDGFTLVEMLVAVALVLLIMSMFAQIFQMAAGSITAQQGIAENDQQARMITGLIRGDLDQRTMRLVLPFVAGEDTRLPAAKLDRRTGYFYYAENDPNSDTDDVLQFTTLVNLGQQQRNEIPYSGKADSAVGTTGALGNSSRTTINSFTVNSLTVNDASRIVEGQLIWLIGVPDTNNNLITNDGAYRVTTISGSTLSISPNLADNGDAIASGVVSFVNEPEFDDGSPNNGVGSSTAAEIVYFLRGGNLYRRVLPIREADTLADAQPHAGNQSRAIWSGGSGNYPIGGGTSRSFWLDFDHSAFHFPGKLTSSGTIAPGVYFHGTGPSLFNGIDGEALVWDETVSPATRLAVSLGVPRWRFGHNRNNGLPREFINGGNADDLSDDSGDFLGRFTAQETAHPDFAYPGYMPSSNPYARNDLSLTTGFATNVDRFTADVGGSAWNSRRGDDIVMTNVLAFDVKLLDPRSFGFVDLGDNSNSLNQCFRSADVLNTNYSPGNNKFRFDTWHPYGRSGIVTSAGSEQPPFRPMSTGADPQPLPVTGIQITITYQNRVDGRVRQVTIVHSLQDRPQAADF